MTPLQPDRPRRALPGVILLFVVIAAIAFAAYLLKPRFESDPPQVSFTPDNGVIGASSTVEIVVRDPGAGLRSIVATLTEATGEQTLASEEFSTPAAEKRITIPAAKLAGLKEGPANLRIHVRDYSYSHLFKGNETLVEKAITVDLTPPSIELLADDRYVNFG